MLEDRHYMQRETSRFPSWTSSPTYVLLILNLAVFLLQNINRVYIHSPWEYYLTLSGRGLLKGYLWQPLTFQFLHFSFTHFFLNAFALYMFGRPVEMALGNARFYELYFTSGAIGGLCQAGLGLVMPQFFGTATMGASAGLCGLIATFCLLYRHETIRLFFVIPIRAWHFFLGSLAIAVFFVLVPSEPGIAHAAHLGGMLAAVAYFHWFIRRERRLLDWRSFHSALHRGKSWPPAQRPKRLSWNRARPQPRRPMPAGDFISQEVDPILDKISAQGIHSLTPKEREILEAARNRMQKR